MKRYTVDSYRAGKKAICRNGQEPKQLTYYEGIENRACFAANIFGSICTFYSDGREFADDESPYDLFEQEEVVETWHNMYGDNDTRVAGYYNSLNDAIKSKAAKAVHIIKLTYNPNKQGNEAYSVEVVHTY